MGAGTVLVRLSRKMPDEWLNDEETTSNNLTTPPPPPFTSPSTYCQGFVDDPTTFMDDHAQEVVHIEEVYNHYCQVIPLSRATPNDTGIDNGDITYFSTSFFVRLHSRHGTGAQHEYAILGCVV